MLVYGCCCGGDGVSLCGCRKYREGIEIPGAMN